MQGSLKVINYYNDDIICIRSGGTGPASAGPNLWYSFCGYMGCITYFQARQKGDAALQFTIATLLTCTLTYVYDVAIIGASLSEPHTSRMYNGAVTVYIYNIIFVHILYKY